jgi:hypothetical protein
MALSGINAQRIVQAVQHFGERLTRFKQGLADRAPDFSEFRRKAAEFFTQFSWNSKKPTITVPQPSRAPASIPPADPSDPSLEGLERPFFNRREDILVEEPVSETAALPTKFNPVEITQDKLEDVGHRIATDAKEAATEFVNILKEAAAEAGEALGKKATELVEAAKETLSSTIDWLAGPPPSPPPAAATFPRFVSQERRQELEKNIESQTEMPWVGQRKPEQTQSFLEHPQPTIIDWEIKPQREGTFFDPKAVREPPAKQKIDSEKLPDHSEQSVTLTADELKQAEKAVRRAAEEVNTEILKEQEARVRDQERDESIERKNRSTQNRRAIPTFDSTRAKRFEHWGEPEGSPAAQQSDTIPNRSPGNEHREIDAAELEKEVRAAVRAIIPPRGILRRDDQSGIPRTPKKVQFSDEIEERLFDMTAEEKAAKLKAIETISEMNVLRKVHDEMRHWHATGDRFIGLMLIALDDTEQPPHRQTDPHTMAMELYGSFVNEAPPGEWADRAESSIREQLEARTRDAALSALEPIIKQFDRYARPASKKFDDGERILHERLGQLGKILQKLQAEQILRTD